MKRFDDLPDEITSEEYRRIAKKSRFKHGKKRVESRHAWVNENSPNRIYNNKQRALDNAQDGEKTIHFDSTSEAKRYTELKALEKQGYLTNLVLQPKFEIAKHGDKVFYYKADFSYILDTDEVIIEEVKSSQKKSKKWYVPNEASMLKMKIFEAYRLANDPTLNFILVDPNSEFYQNFEDAKFT